MQKCFEQPCFMLIYFYRNLIKGRCILKNVSFKNIQKDIISGIIVALVSIPISMGYAQIAGLPAVYGLYCSILPVLIYGLVTSSPQFVFGVDATPAALVGGTLATLGIVSGSEEAKALVPAITLVAALWLLIFFFIKAGPSHLGKGLQFWGINGRLHHFWLTKERSSWPAI